MIKTTTGGQPRPVVTDGAIKIISYGKSLRTDLIFGGNNAI